MTEQEALAKMVAPGTPRAGKYRQGVIQIWVTRACDKSCFGCTQGSNLAGKPHSITLEQFERACVSLKDYWGVVGMFGGNPCTHPQFEELCAIMRRWIKPEQRGLWSNNPLGKGATARKTFNPSVSNLNVHLDRKAYEEFKRDWPECGPVGLENDSRHSPPYVAMKDVIADESKRWELISACDINQHWSAMIGVFRNELRAWFCEIAGAQAMLHQDDPDYPDTGIEPIRYEDTFGDGLGDVMLNWWQLSMRSFAPQVRKHCHECGVPLRGYGELAQAKDKDGCEQTSITHEGIYKPKRPNRGVQVVHQIEDLGNKRLNRVTSYLQNAKV